MKAGWIPSAITSEGTEVVSSDVLSFTFRRFGERVFVFPAESENEAVQDITMAWGMFVNTHTADFNKLFSAFNTEYQPLENYRMVETGEANTEHSRTGQGTSTANISETTTDNTKTTRTDNLTGELKRTGTINTEGTESTETADTSTRTDNLTNELKRTGTIGTEGTESAQTADTSTRTDNLTGELKRTGDTTTSGTDTSNTADTTSITTINTGTQTTADTTSTENKVAAYDTDTYSPRDKQENSGNNTRTDDLTQTATHSGGIDTNTTTTATVTNNTTDTTKNTGTQETANTGTTATETTDTTATSNTETGNENTAHTLTRSGNIGVTTSQQMLTSEILLRVKNQLAYYAVELFVSQFTTW